MGQLVSEIKTQRNAADEYLKQKRKVWDSIEELSHGILTDQVSQALKSQVFDPKLFTLNLERSYRVMAQLQTGKVIGVSRNDMGDAILKNLMLEKYVIPNANAQFDFLTKMRMVDMYSGMYGNFFTLIDWDIKRNGYIGPDVWLLNIRDVFPQVGAVSLEDSDYVIVRTWRPLSYFENLRKDKDYVNIDKIIEKLKSKTGSKDQRDSENLSKREQNEYSDTPPAKGKGYFEVLTRFERDRWVDICVDADMEFRDIKNQHDDGDLPVKCKYSIPLLDDFMGMGDMERGASMQKTINSVWNLYLDGVAMSIFPPVLINKDNIASASSFKYEKLAKWLVRNQIDNSVRPMQLSPQGIREFNNVYQVATASILNMFGTTDTNVTSVTDPGFGKTPQALQMQAQRENTRDNADRFFMEQYLKQVMKKFCNLLAKKQSTAIKVRLFEPEIEDLARSYPEIKESYDEKSGNLTVKKGSGNEIYDYEIVSGSTYAVDQKQEQENLGQLLSLYQAAQTPQGNILVNDLKQQGYEFKFGELMKRIISRSGIQDWDKILTEMTPQEQADHTLQSDAQRFQEALNQMGGQGQVPVTPGQPMEIPNGIVG